MADYMTAAKLQQKRSNSAKDSRLPGEFFARNTKTVAKELLGKILVHGNKRGKIVETEAYFGTGDPGSHAFRGPTPRSKIMFGPPGHAYVYFTYGAHWMLNFICEKDSKPGAVLIRALEPIKPKNARTNGPAKLTKAFGISGKHNGADLTSGKIYVEGSDEKPKIITATRIGLAKGKGDDLKLRFYIAGNNFVSRK